MPFSYLTTKVGHPDLSHNVFVGQVSVNVQEVSLKVNSYNRSIYWHFIRAKNCVTVFFRSFKTSLNALAKIDFKVVFISLSWIRSP